MVDVASVLWSAMLSVFGGVTEGKHTMSWSPFLDRSIMGRLHIARLCASALFCLVPAGCCVAFSKDGISRTGSRITLRGSVAVWHTAVCRLVRPELGRMQ